MGIDLVTLIAQIINLLVLIWLLKRFLYRPVLNMIKERQELIDEQINRAKQVKQNALAEEAEYQKKVAAFDAERNEMFKQMQNQVDDLREKLTLEAKQDVAHLRQAWKNELEQEKQAFDISIQNAIVQNFKLFASDALKDMAGVELNALVIKKFKERVEKMPVAQRDQIIQNASSAKQITVLTDTRLDTPVKEDLQKFLISTFDLKKQPVKINFKVDENLICGIQVQAGEQVTSWNLQNYLEAFENNMDAAFNELIHQGA